MVDRRSGNPVNAGCRAAATAANLLAVSAVAERTRYENLSGNTPLTLHFQCPQERSGMRKIFPVALLALVLAAAPLTPAAAKAPPQSDLIPGGYIVTLKDTAAPEGAGMDAAVDEAVEQATTLGAEVQHEYRYALHGYAASMSPSVAATLADDPRVRSVEPNRRVQTTAQSVPTGVDRVEADKSPTAAIDGVDTRVDADVAVIDTGINPSHSDLNVYRDGGKNCWLPFLPPPTGTVTARMSPEPSAPWTTAPGWSVRHRAPGSGQCRCSTPRAAAPPRRSSAASTTSPSTPTRSRSPT